MSLAATAFNEYLVVGASYTVPPNKTAIFAIRMILITAGPGNSTFLINGVNAGQLIAADAGSFAIELKPYACNAGDVILNSSGSSFPIALSGFLY
jgi:hypothetical protein